MLEEIRTKVERIATEVVAPAAGEVDRGGKFPEIAVAALGEAGLLGVISSNTLYDFIGRASCGLPVFAQAVS
jgi:alkylation response protein AidB-like acyl-CoA dehydrogenase